MASDDDINIMMHVVGNFKGLDALIRNKEITQEEAGNLRAYAFKRIGVKVAEIRTEVAKLQGVVQTLETVCLQVPIQSRQPPRKVRSQGSDRPSRSSTVGRSASLSRITN